MARTTPFHPRTSALATSLAYKEWAGYHAVCTYDRHSEAEYFAFRHTAGLIDVTPLYKLDVTGPDAARLVSRVFTRDVGQLRPSKVAYTAMADPQGECIDDGTVQRLGKNHFRCSTSESWFRWIHTNSRGLDVEIADVTDQISVLALQGPLARAILDPICDFDLQKMRFFRVQSTKVAGLKAHVSRTGYTGDLGYEIWMENGDALALWDALMEEGRPHDLHPCGLDALDVVRIEAGFVLQGVDYVSARHCLTDALKSTPFEAGLGWTVDLDRDPFVGSRALAAERKRGSEWALVGLELDWKAIEALYDRYHLPPHLAPCASRVAVPIYDRVGGKQVGQLTSSTWSPITKRFLGIGQVYTPHATLGNRLYVEHTPEFRREVLPATVVDTPFYDPDRKTSVPARKRKKESDGAP